MSELVYVYAILREPPSGSLFGIDGRPVRFIAQAELVAAVSDVPAEEFSEEPLNRHIRDMQWLGPRAVAHQDVNERLWERSQASVPLAFGTVFHDDQRVRDVLGARASVLGERLSVVEGCAEWVVTLHRVAALNPTELVSRSEALRDLHAQIEASSPGRAHLLRRQAATLERDEVRRLDAEAVEALSQALRPAVEDVFAEAVAADGLERPLVRLSVLVKRSEERRFLQAVERVRERWPEPTYRVALTGPWPAYRFGGIEPGAQHA